MAKINLLPWRDELRKQRQQDFMVAIGVGVVITSLLFGFVYFYIEAMKDAQQRRNQFLEAEIRFVDNKIKEIKDIETKKAKMQEKIDVIEDLQKSRPQIVHLFDELGKRTPKGIYLTKFTQKGKELTFKGKAQSNARVSAYMRGVEASDWLETPLLQIIKHQGKKAIGRQNDFTMLAKQGIKKPKNLEGKQ